MNQLEQWTKGWKTINMEVEMREWSRNETGCTEILMHKNKVRVVTWFLLLLECSLSTARNRIGWDIETFREAMGHDNRYAINRCCNVG